MDLTQSQEQDKIIQYYLNQQIKKVAIEKSQLTLQQEAQRNKIKLQVWEFLNQQQPIQHSRLKSAPLNLIYNNTAQSDGFDVFIDKSKIKKQSSKFEQSMQFQKEQPHFQINYHSFVESKDQQYKKLDFSIAQHEEKPKNIPRNYFQRTQPDNVSNQLQQDYDDNDEQYNQDFEQDQEIQELIEEEIQESQWQIEQKPQKSNYYVDEKTYNNLIKLKIDKLDSSDQNAGNNKLTNQRKNSDSINDLKGNSNEVNKILEISEQVDAFKQTISKYTQNPILIKSNYDESSQSQISSNLIELSQQQPKIREKQKLEYPPMPIFNQEFSYKLQDQSQIINSYYPNRQIDQMYNVDQSKFQQSISGLSNQKNQFEQIQKSNLSIGIQSKYHQQNQSFRLAQQQKYDNTQPSVLNDVKSQFQEQDYQKSLQPSKLFEPQKTKQLSELNIQDDNQNQICLNTYANQQNDISEIVENETFYQGLQDNNNLDDYKEELHSEEFDHTNQYCQFDIKFEDQDEEEKLKKYEALKRKKIQEMEELKQFRQQKNKEQQKQNSLNNKRDQSPLMPSASLKRLKCQQQQQNLVQQQQNSFNQLYQQQKQQFQQRNLYQDNQPQPIQTSIPQSKRNASNNRKSPMSRQKETVHFCQDIDKSISVEKNKKNNKTMIKSAITYACLAGEPNKKERDTILQKLDGVEGDHFIILFKTYGRSDFRALYGYAVDSQPQFIFGQGKCPQILTSEMVKTFFKYDSGAKQFKAIDGNKQFTIMVDAVQLRK